VAALPVVPEFSCCKYQYVKNIPNGRKYTNRLLNIPTFSVPRPSKIYTNWDFWFAKILSGNSGPIIKFFSSPVPDDGTLHRNK
jgi:hypothetical protein